MAKGVLRGDRVADLGQGDTQMMTHHHKYLSLINRPLILPCTAICEHTNYWMRKRKKSCFELHNWRLMDHIILVLTFVFLFLLKNDEMYFFNLLVLLHGGCYTPCSILRAAVRDYITILPVVVFLHLSSSPTVYLNPVAFFGKMCL